MPGITIEKFGFSFVLECLEAYWGDALLYLLCFLICILGLLFFRKYHPDRLFVTIFFVLLFTIYNPLILHFLVPMLDLNTTYYRLFWLLPVSCVLAYSLVRISTWSKHLPIQLPLILVCLFLLTIGGMPLESAVHPALPDNIYKVPDDLVTACEMIHADSEEEQPTVVFDINLNMLARQYDPSLLLALERNNVLYRAGSQTIGTVNTESNAYKAQKAIMDVVYYGEEIPLNRFQAGLRWRKVDYLVVPSNNTKLAFIQEAGCIPVGTCEKYTIFRCEVPEV